jgi:hypothetical protein
MTEEIWRPVVGHEGAYEVSNLGRVRSVDRIKTIHRRDGHTGEEMYVSYKITGRILRLDTTNKGYFRVMLGRHGPRKSVHQLVLEAFIGPCPPGEESLHADDVSKNNCLENLSWGTKSKNQHDAIRNGKSPTGERKANAKLSNNDVIAIRSRLAAVGWCIAEIARDYGVSESAIRNIKIGRSWRHLS